MEKSVLTRVPRAVLVHGPSMVPTLRHGDAVLVRPGTHRVRPGDVVVAHFRARPELLVVKRAIRPYQGGWWLESDNPFVTDDSRTYGAADVLGRAVFRYLPLRRLGRLRSTPPVPGVPGAPDLGKRSL
jgi:phage repressor protein C with HTH and peptisase S24 domain